MFWNAQRRPYARWERWWRRLGATGRGLGPHLINVCGVRWTQGKWDELEKRGSAACDVYYKLFLQVDLYGTGFSHTHFKHGERCGVAGHGLAHERQRRHAGAPAR